MKRSFVLSAAGLGVFALVFSLIFPTGGVAAEGPGGLRGSGPGTPRKSEAGQRAAPRENDLVDLLATRQVEAEVTGESIEFVNVKLRRLVPAAIKVGIPVGLYFVSRNSSAQNMVSTEARSVLLRDSQWVSVMIPAACTNRSRDIPEGADRFDVARSPQQAELARLMPMLSRAKANFAVTQAAVWIVTDDADYDDLGILTESYGPLGLGGSRVIRAAEAARAMKIAEEAGIDVTRKAIWNDREKILQQLKEGELKRWLRRRAGVFLNLRPLREPI